MQPCKVGLSKQVHSGSLLKFCSEDCIAVAEQDVDTTSPVTVSLPALDRDSLEHSKPTDVTSTLTLQFHAKKIAKTFLAKNTLVKVSLFVEKSSVGTGLFVLQQLRVLNNQVILGFSISEELAILEPLPCYVGVKTVPLETVRDCTRMIIQESLLHLGFHDVQSLCEKQ